MERNEPLALALDTAVRDNLQDDWRNNLFKVKRVKNAIKEALHAGGAFSSVVTGSGARNVSPSRDPSAPYSTEAEERELDSRADEILKLVTSQNEY